MTCARGCCPDFATHVRSLSLIPRVSPTTLVDRQWDRDMSAYKRMRVMGEQPSQIDGSARVEALAETKFEFDRHKPIRNPTTRREANRLYSEVGNAG